MPLFADLDALRPLAPEQEQRRLPKLLPKQR